MFYNEEFRVHYSDFSRAITMAEGDTVDMNKFPLSYDGPLEGVRYPLKVQYIEGNAFSAV